MNTRLRAAFTGRPAAEQLHAWGALEPLTSLTGAALELTLAGFGSAVSYSRKVFIPLTQLCRDVCHYCTFARTPRRVAAAYMTPAQVLDVAQAGQRVGCGEALFTLGDKPELRYQAARDALARLGYASTIDYLQSVAALVVRETVLLPHLNPGILGEDDYRKLRGVSVSMGLMLESSAERLTLAGGPHFGSPDKAPAVRLQALRLAGELSIPMTTGLLVGIGETRAERIDAILALRDLHDRYGHIQEIIIQGFRAKPGTRMRAAPEPEVAEMLWTIAMTRLAFGPLMSIQTPPNLQPDALPALLGAGINDWGGLSPVTPDYVNPEAPWPEIERLALTTASCGRDLVERLAIAPGHARELERWVDGSMRQRVLAAVDAGGYRREHVWHAGSSESVPALSMRRSTHGRPTLDRILARSARGEDLESMDIAQLFQARGAAVGDVIAAADEVRQATVGEAVSFVVNRNINYTNICLFHCSFCAFSKAGSVKLRGKAYRLDLEEISRRAAEAADAGATEVCLQGGIHPEFTGDTYLDIVGAIKRAQPALHIHAFSPLEVMHGARTLHIPVAEFLARLRSAGLASLPGTAAEILSDDVRKIICPDKVTTAEWLAVLRDAHAVGLKTTATIMFGHIEAMHHWVEHLLALRRLAAMTRGITEFVPLPFVHMGAPLWRRGVCRPGPTFREAVLMHSVGRLVLHPVIRNIQTSWVKMGADGALICLQAGANDLGGTLMNESITRAAGGVHGQELSAARFAELAHSIGRPIRQRTTLYGEVAAKRRGPAASRRDDSQACA